VEVVPVHAGKERVFLELVNTVPTQTFVTAAAQTANEIAGFHRQNWSVVVVIVIVVVILLFGSRPGNLSECSWSIIFEYVPTSVSA
jgi:hypothetical protein